MEEPRDRRRRRPGDSPDGTSLYYTKTPDDSAVWKMPVAGGDETQMVPRVRFWNFVPLNDGIYFVAPPDSAGKHSIQFLSFATGATRTLASIPGLPREGLTVSPDRRTILYTQHDSPGSDLMLVENFR
jgi:hypothetical protein